MAPGLSDTTGGNLQGMPSQNKIPGATGNFVRFRQSDVTNKSMAVSVYRY